MQRYIQTRKFSNSKNLSSEPKLNSSRSRVSDAYERPCFSTTACDYFVFFSVLQFVGKSLWEKVINVDFPSKAVRICCEGEDVVSFKRQRPESDSIFVSKVESFSFLFPDVVSGITDDSKGFNSSALNVRKPWAPY